MNRYRMQFLKICGLITSALLMVVVANAQSSETDSKDADAQNVSEKSFLVMKGRVVDASTKQGFAGARLTVVSEKISAMTEDDGAFEIKVPRKDVSFLVEAPGYQTQMVALKGRSELTVYMLKPVGKTAFYDDAVFSPNGFSSIADFSPNILTIDEDITARMAGHLRAITHSGIPGGGSAIFVNGLNSLNATAQPLYIVDGVIWQVQDGDASMHEGFFKNPLAVIDPNDVQKITVLKTGTSLYGAKGANGVVLIDTKRGVSMATSVAASMSIGYRSPFNSIPVMDADNYRVYASDVLSQKFSNSSAVDKYRFLDDDPSRSYYKSVHNNTDWLDLINRGAMMQNYGISVQGGDDIALYSLSLGYAQGDGNIKNTEFNRLNVRFNSDVKMSERLSMKFDIGFAQTIHDLRNDGIDSVSSPYYLALIKSPLYKEYLYTNSGNLSTRLSNVDELRVGNPLALINAGRGESKQYALNTVLRPSYTILPNKLEISALFAFVWNKLDENSFVPDYGTVEQSLYNEQGEIYGIGLNRVQDLMNRHTSVSAEARLDWNVVKNSVHNLDVYGGYRFFSDTYRSHYDNGYNVDDKTAQVKAAALNKYATGIDDSWKSMSWYANVDYAYLNRYLLNVTTALDGSSRFGTDANNALHMGGIAWGCFPSVSAGWILSSESFMKNIQPVNYFKLSAGYGISGNDNLPNNANRTFFSSMKFNGGAYGLVLSNIGNEQLKWEQTAMSFAGFDASFFNNLWWLKGKIYASTTSDLLTRKKLNEEAGLMYYWCNEGELSNKGYELSTGLRLLDLRDWKVNFGASMGHYKNEITSLPNGSFPTEIAGAVILTEEGQPAGVFYGYKTKGVLASKAEAQDANLFIMSKSGQLKAFEAGDMYFAEVKQDGIIDENDMQVIGDPNPDLYGNFNFNVNWKKFSLDALFTYSYGNDVYNALRANLESGKNEYNASTAMQNRWVAEGQVTSIPRATYGDPMGNARFSDRWIEDGSYLRFKSLSLSYTLPLQLTYIQGLTVWGSVSNIYTFTKYLGADPEFAYGNNVLYQGIDAGLIPQTRSFNIGVKINL